MPDTHGSHGLVELVAALVLSIGGGAILVRAWLDRRDREAPPALAGPPPDHQHGIAARSFRRATAATAAGLSAAAALVHLAAGPEHVEALGDLGLGFYAAGLFQGAFAIAWWSTARSRRLAGVGIAVNAVLIGAWAWSRSVGLPTAGGPEAAGIADLTVVALQVALIALLLGRLRGLERRVPTVMSAARLRTATTSGLVVVLGVIALSTTIAVADATAGHGHGDPAHADAGAGPHFDHGAVQLGP